MQTAKFEIRWEEDDSEITDADLVIFDSYAPSLEVLERLGPNRLVIRVNMEDSTKLSRHFDEVGMEYKLR